MGCDDPVLASEYILMTRKMRVFYSLARIVQLVRPHFHRVHLIYRSVFVRAGIMALYQKRAISVRVARPLIAFMEQLRILVQPAFQNVIYRPEQPGVTQAVRLHIHQTAIGSNKHNAPYLGRGVI